MLAGVVVVAAAVAADPGQDAADGRPADATAAVQSPDPGVGSHDGRDEEVAPDPQPVDEVEPASEPEGDSEAAGTPLPSGDLQVHYLDVGQADATLLVHDEVAVLIDAGHWQRSEVTGYLATLGIDRLDLVVITHPHADHIGQFDQVMAAVEVDEVWWSGSVTTTQTFERAVAALEASTADYEEPRAGQSTTVGPLSFDIVNPPSNVDLTDLHDASLGLRVTYGDVRFLFTGDAEAPAEQRMVATADQQLAADILKLGHHGSNTSTTAPFLDAVGPQVAIYSAGVDNEYGHPHDEVIQRVQAAGIEIFGTPVHGTITVTTDGASWDIITGLEGTVTVPPPTDDTSDPQPEPAPDPDPSEPAAGCGPGTVDINSADAETLQQIIHIGPERADDVISMRPFDTVSSLSRLDGIGPGRLQDIISEGVACAG